MRGNLFVSIARTARVLALLLVASWVAVAQTQGDITGVVTPPAANLVVIVTNQVTSKVTTATVSGDGGYSLRVHPGAYRLSVARPYRAKFDNAKTYGEHALIREDSLENVIVSEGKETKIDFAVEKIEAKPIVNIPERKPLGAAGKASVASAPQTQSDAREVRDRWRIGFPEYDRYGDKGARGRDIPFRKGRWFDPYNQSWLKGDYPIFGNKVFMILSAVSFTTTELSRTPKPSDVSSARPGSAEFFGKPEALAVNQIFQFTFELFHGDSTYKPRDWAIKISPTFSLPNYL
ncbi:MAG TPA: carboxypeptidase-like regulatory domain-containing protein, partial [Pyrinomonadaceae bacterium]